MPATGMALVRGDWVNGNLVVYDNAGNIIFTIDGTNRKVTFPSGAALELAAGDLVTAEIADGAVTFAKAKAFVSTEQTGTGSSQNVAHGLGTAPSKVLVVPTEHPGTPDTGAFDIAEGAHDATNVVVTVTANVKFKVLAWA